MGPGGRLAFAVFVFYQCGRLSRPSSSICPSSGEPCHEVAAVEYPRPGGSSDQSQMEPGKLQDAEHHPQSGGNLPGQDASRHSAGQGDAPVEGTQVASYPAQGRQLPGEQLEISLTGRGDKKQGDTTNETEIKMPSLSGGATRN